MERFKLKKTIDQLEDQARAASVGHFLRRVQVEFERDNWVLRGMGSEDVALARLVYVAIQNSDSSLVLKRVFWKGSSTVDRVFRVVLGILRKQYGRKKADMGFLALSSFLVGDIQVVFEPGIVIECVKQSWGGLLQVLAKT